MVADLDAIRSTPMENSAESARAAAARLYIRALRLRGGTTEGLVPEHDLRRPLSHQPVSYARGLSSADHEVRAFHVGAAAEAAAELLGHGAERVRRKPEPLDHRNRLPAATLLLASHDDLAA